MPNTEPTIETIEPLRWSVHLLKRDPWRGVVVIVCMAAVALIGGFALKHWLMSVIGVWMVFTATVEYLLPIRYEISAKGVSSRCLWQWQQIAWENARFVTEGKRAIKVSSVPLSSRLDAFRGVLLRFPDENGDSADALKTRALEAIDFWRSRHAALGQSIERRTESAASG